MKHAAWLLALAAMGCATSGSFNWAVTPHADIRVLAAKHPRAVAVVVERDERLVLTFDRSAPASVLQRHDIIAILAEGGDRYAEVAIPVGDGSLSFLRARTIDPDGKVEEVTPEEVHTAVARTGSGIDGVESTVKLFRVPGARVGSVVEYAYGLVNEKRTYYVRNAMSARIPVEHYHFELTASGPVDLAIRYYNANPDVEKEEHYDKRVLRLDQRDIPAQQQEVLAPPSTVTEPWWAVSVTKMLARRQLVGIFDTWSHAMSGVGHVLYDDKGKDYAVPSLKPSVADCNGSVRCIAERALVLVNAKTELSRFVSSLFDVRPLNEVLASASANNIEKALLLRSALAVAGVKASFVALARSVGADFDPNFPSPGRADHLIVVVDKQPGLEQPLLIDPSCEACDVGQLPPWTTDRQGMLFGKPSAPAMYAQLESPIQLVHIDGAAAVTTGHRQLIDVNVDAAGNTSGRLTDEWRGQQAVDFRIASRTWLEDRWRKEVEDDLHARAKTAELDALTPVAWDKRDAAAKLSVTWKARGYATVDGERLIVPLSFMRMESDRDPGDEPRQHDVMIREATREEETLVLHLPSGWVASELPRGAVWHSQAADGLLEVKSAPGTVTIRRVLQMHVGHWGPGEFDELLGVFRNLAAARQMAFAIRRLP